MIPCQRHLFDIPEDVVYLDCAKMSPLSRAALEAGARGLRRKAQPWDIRAEHFFDESEEVRSLFAQLLGATADDIAIIPSVSYAMALVAANVALGDGDEILTIADDFPSGILAMRSLARSSGAVLRTIAEPPEGSWSDAVLAAIGDRTRLVLMPHTHWVYGTMFDLAAIGRRCREARAMLVLDTTQSTGALPLDLAAVAPDFLVASAYKWLMCPYTIAFLYAAPRHQQGRPLEEAWITRSNAQDFRSLAAYEDGFAAGARRFDMGERANFATLPAAAAAIRQLLGWGIAEIADTLGALTGRIEAALAGRAEAARDRAPHFLSVRFARQLPDDVERRLAAAGVHVSLRGDRMRITPHLYNHHADIERLVRELA